MPWNFADPFPNLPLGDVVPLSARALSWLARASKGNTFPQDRYVQICRRRQNAGRTRLSSRKLSEPRQSPGHRSIDAPRKEVHAMAFSFHFLSVASFPVFQSGTKDNRSAT